MLLLGGDVEVWDMAGILRNRRGLRGKERKGHLVAVMFRDLKDEDEVKRKQTESAVRKRSGKDGRATTRLSWRLVSGCCGGGDISGFSPGGCSRG